MTTLYRICVDQADRCFLVEPAPAYRWSGCAKKAMRLARREAVAAAEQLALAIRGNGYLGVRVIIVPATGGAPIGESFRS